jgi:hypothetical protein
MTSWQVEERDVAALSERGWNVVASSARTGVGVNEAFKMLGQRLLEN